MTSFPLPLQLVLSSAVMAVFGEQHSLLAWVLAETGWFCALHQEHRAPLAGQVHTRGAGKIRPKVKCVYTREGSLVWEVKVIPFLVQGFSKDLRAIGTQILGRQKKHRDSVSQVSSRKFAGSASTYILQMPHLLHCC